MVTRADVEKDLLATRTRRQEGTPAAPPATKHVCAGCHSVFAPERLERCLCEDCRKISRCASCGKRFVPDTASFGRVCSTCWSDFTSEPALTTTLERLTPVEYERELHRLVFGGPRWR